MSKKQQEPFFLGSLQNALIGNTFCIPHVHVFSANLYLILRENLVQGLFHVQKCVTDRNTSPEDLKDVDSLRGF